MRGNGTLLRLVAHRAEGIEPEGAASRGRQLIPLGGMPGAVARSRHLPGSGGVAYTLTQYPAEERQPGSWEGPRERPLAEHRRSPRVRLMLARQPSRDPEHGSQLDQAEEREQRPAQVAIHGEHLNLRQGLWLAAILIWGLALIVWGFLIRA